MVRAMAASAVVTSFPCQRYRRGSMGASKRSDKLKTGASLSQDGQDGAISPSALACYYLASIEALMHEHATCLLVDTPSRRDCLQDIHSTVPKTVGMGFTHSTSISKSGA